MIVPSSAAPVGAPGAVERTTLGPNLIKNSGFSSGFNSWARAKGNGGALEIASGGVWGSRQAAAMRTRQYRTSSPS